MLIPVVVRLIETSLRIYLLVAHLGQLCFINTNMAEECYFYIKCLCKHGVF